MIFKKTLDKENFVVFADFLKSAKYESFFQCNKENRQKS